MSEKDDGGPAFPSPPITDATDERSPGTADNAHPARVNGVVSAELGFGHRLTDQLKINDQPLGIRKREMYRYDHPMLPLHPVSIEDFERDMRSSR